MAVTAVPLIEDNNILLNELPRVKPYPFSNGSAVIFAKREFSFFISEAVYYFV